MNSQGRSDSDLKNKWLDRVPLVWKRKIKNFIKNDHRYALETFFDNFKQGKHQKQMRYGLEQLLPESLYLILNSFDKFNNTEIASFLDLLATPEFLNQISALDSDNQELLLMYIYEHWNSELLNKILLKKILQKLDLTHTKTLYNKIQKENSSVGVEIIQLWGLNALKKILPLFLQSPTELIIPLFQEISSKQRLDILSEELRSVVTSKKQFQTLMRLVILTEDELSHLMSLQPSLSQETQKLFIDWLIKQRVSQELIVKVYQQNIPEKNFQFLIQYLIIGINSKVYQASELLVLLLISNENQIAHEILRQINVEKAKDVVEILVVTLEKLQDQLFRYLSFFKTEFITYSPQNIKLILETYLNSPYESLHSLLLPILQGATAKKWRFLLKTTVESKTSPPSHLVTDIFINCSKITKLNLGNYVVEQSWISQLSFLFNDFNIFQSVLVYPKKLSINNQALLESSLRQHVTNQLEEIILLGRKVTYPKLAFATIMDKNSLSEMINTIDKSKSRKILLSQWEEVFLACADDSILTILKMYSLKTGSGKDYLVPLLKQLISLELTQFWQFLNGQSPQDLPNLLPILPHAFEESIPNLNTYLSHLPESNFEFLLKEILPDFISSSGSKIIYSLFSIEDTRYFNEGVVKRTILELIKHNKDFLLIALIRCSKTISNPELEKIVTGLSIDLLTLEPENSLKIIEANSLTSLIPQVRRFFASLHDDRITELFLLLIPTLESKILTPFIVDFILSKPTMQNIISILENILSDYEMKDYSSEGEVVLKDLVKNLVGKSDVFDLLIYNSFYQKPKSQALLLQIYLSRIPQSTVEKLILDPKMEISEEKTIDAIIEHFKSFPPENPERYFFDLYQTVTKKAAKNALLPLLGEYCSWTNLSVLMELSEKNKPEYDKAYHKALTNFARRYNIHSSGALLEIWNTGLKDVYNQRLQKTAIWQSNCPQCGYPILENQKNCGFCTQRLTCVICLQSVVKAEKNDITKCPQCGNFFHRHHLLESIKLQNRCPVCNIKLTETEVTSLPSFTFSFH